MVVKFNISRRLSRDALSFTLDIDPSSPFTPPPLQTNYRVAMSLRRSKRVKTNHVAMPAPSRVAATNATTQAVTTDGAVRLRRGCLQDLPDKAVELQLEVTVQTIISWYESSQVFQIFGQLEPQDLFNLSRSCKKFRTFFLNRNNERLWDSAIRNAEDLPPRPPWMSIPGFIHLLFSPTCHVRPRWFSSLMSLH